MVDYTDGNIVDYSSLGRATLKEFKEVLGIERAQKAFFRNCTHNIGIDPSIDMSLSIVGACKSLKWLSKIYI